MILTPFQIELLNEHFIGLPSHNALSKAIKSDPKLEALRPLLKKGLNFEDVARGNQLRRVLKRTTDAKVWQSKEAKQALREFYAELCTRHQTLLSNSALLNHIKASKQLEFDNCIIDIKASTLADKLQSVFWPDTSKGDYGHIATLQVELLSEKKIKLNGFDYHQQFDLDNLHALGQAIQHNPSHWSIKNTINNEPLLTKMIIAARMLTEFDKFPGYREIVACNDPLIGTVALEHLDYFRDETKICDVLPVATDARLSFAGKHGLKRLEAFFIDLCQDRNKMLRLAEIEVLSKDYCRETIKRAVESHGFANITEFQADLVKRGKLKFTHKGNQGALRIDATKNGTAGEIMVGQILQSSSVRKKLEQYSVPATVESQCYVPKFHRKVDFVLGKRMIVEVMMVKTEQMFTALGVPDHRVTEANYINKSKNYYYNLVEHHEVPQLIIGAENTVRTRRDEVKQLILDAIERYFCGSTLPPELDYQPTTQTACNYDLLGIARWLQGTLFYDSGSRLLPSRAEIAIFPSPKWESAIVNMTHIGTDQICKLADLSFEARLGQMNNLDLEDSTIRMTILEKHFGHLTYLPTLGCWSKSLNPLKAFYKTQGLNLAVDDAKKMWIEPVKAPKSYYECNGYLDLENIAATITKIKPILMGSRVFPTKYQLELESHSGAYKPMQTALDNEETQMRLCELTGLMTIEQYVKKAITVAQEKLNEANYSVNQQMIKALTGHLQRQAKLEWKMPPAHRYSRFF
ncbi:hypothetical protein DR996_15865 [Vibrio owensii]|nr:hypothetical protein DR996_15865 [Vibrio owensii]